MGLIPNRHDASKIIVHIPEQFHKYFILGIFDADGSFSAYKGDYGSKLSISFGGAPSLLRFIENHLISNNLAAMRKIKEHKLEQRHEGKDGNWRTISFSGVPQCMKILNYLYDSPIYLDRKYQKYLAIPYHNS